MFYIDSTLEGVNRKTAKVPASTLHSIKKTLLVKSNSDSVQLPVGMGSDIPRLDIVCELNGRVAGELYVYHPYKQQVLSVDPIRYGFRKWGY